MTAGRIILLIVGIIIALVALALLVGGAALVIIYATQRDDDGYFTSPRYDLQSDGYALVSEDVDIATQPADWWSSDLASVRFAVESTSGAPVFIGIGPADDVSDYLSGVALDRIVTLDENPDGVEYESSGGGAPATAPGEQTFWDVSAEGSGEQTLTWDVESGSWTIVVMNADASSPVAVETAIGGKVDALLPIGIGMLIGGLIAGIIAAILIMLATRRRGRSDRETETRRRPVVE